MDWVRATGTNCLYIGWESERLIGETVKPAVTMDLLNQCARAPASQLVLWAQFSSSDGRKRSQETQQQRFNQRQRQQKNEIEETKKRSLRRRFIRHLKVVQVPWRHIRRWCNGKCLPSVSQRSGWQRINAIFDLHKHVNICSVFRMFWKHVASHGPKRKRRRVNGSSLYLNSSTFASLIGECAEIRAIVIVYAFWALEINMGLTPLQCVHAKYCWAWCRWEIVLFGRDLDYGKRIVDPFGMNSLGNLVESGSNWKQTLLLYQTPDPTDSCTKLPMIAQQLDQTMQKLRRQPRIEQSAGIHVRATENVHHLCPRNRFEATMIRRITVGILLVSQPHGLDGGG